MNEINSTNRNMEFVDDLTYSNSTTDDIASTSSTGGSSPKHVSTGSSSRCSTASSVHRIDMQLGRCPWIRVYDNVTYIVSGIVLRNNPQTNDHEILLIQEAKQKCRGKWYIPAGHVEPGETIDQACKREMIEETGLECVVETLICMEIRGSGWYRMAFLCHIVGGTLKTVPDEESLAAGWHSITTVRNRSSGLQLRCRDFMNILNSALRYEAWKCSIPQPLLDSLKWHPILNQDEAQPGLFIEFVIIRKSGISEKIDCLIHKSVSNELQLLDEKNLIEAFPSVEFGFEYFFPTVVSKCYRHIIEGGHTAVEMPDSVIGFWCLPAPVTSTRQGIRLRVLCKHKRSMQKGVIRSPNRYHWITLESNDVLASLYLLPDQFRPQLFLL